MFAKKPANPGSTIPAGALVFLFTGNDVTVTYDLGDLCASGKVIYVLQSDCNRTAGAFLLTRSTATGGCASGSSTAISNSTLTGAATATQYSISGCDTTSLSGLGFSSQNITSGVTGPISKGTNSPRSRTVSPKRKRTILFINPVVPVLSLMPKATWSPIST